MAFAAVQVLVTLGILFVYTDQASAQFFGCFRAAGCNTGDDISGFTSAEECCLSDAGMYYDNGTCQQCVVYGWIDTELVAAEAAVAHSARVGYIKGSGSRLRLNIEVIHGTTSPGDVIVNSQVLLPPGNIDIFFVVDSIAQEIQEEATLRLCLLAGNPPAGSFLRSDLRLIVDDSDNVIIEFNQVDYAENERLNMSVTVRKLLPIANPVELLITPLTVEQYVDRQQNPPLEPSQSIPASPSFSPNRAKSDMDFSPDKISITFEADSEGGRVDDISVSIPLLDDEIDEADPEFFILILETVSAVNTDGVMLERPASIGMIADNDEIVIGFERSSYTFGEPPFEIEFVDVLLVKENDVTTEQDYNIAISVIPIAPPGTGFTPATRGTMGGGMGADFALSGSQTIAGTVVPINSIAQNKTVPIVLFADSIPEGTEAFQLTTSPVSDSANPGPQYTPASTNSTVFASTFVILLDDDDIIIGWEQDYVVDENVGSFNACYIVIAPPLNELFMLVDTFPRTADESDYTPISSFNFEQERSLPAGVVNARACVTVTINDDNRYENDETFVIMLVPLSPGPILDPINTTITIRDTTEIIIGFIDPPHSALENEGLIVFTVGVIGGTAIEGMQVDVSFTTQDATSGPNQATAGIDYTSNSGQTLTFTSSTSTLTVSVPINDDNILEPSEVFLGDLDIVSNQPRVVVSPEQAIATILNDEVLNIIRVNDTVIGDPLMTVPLYVKDKSSIMPLGEEDIVHLCFEVHGRADEYFNLVSDEGVSVNAHYERVQPDEDINIIDIIAVRAVDSVGDCHDITVDLDQCRASVDDVTLADTYASNDISVRRYPRRVRISVPNVGSATGLVMWVFCQTQTFWSRSRSNPDGSEFTFQGDAIRFVIARGLNLRETSHGILAPPSNRVNDTVTGDPLFTVPLNIQDKTSIMNVGEDDPINLCFEVHGQDDAYFNLVSDTCVSVNAHYSRVRAQDDINIVDSIHVRAVDSDGTCRNIDVSLDQCSASVDGTAVSTYSSASVSVRRFRNRVRISVPNCQDIDLVMWVFCVNNTFWSREDEDGNEVTFTAEMIRFVVARGLDLDERSHGLIGQFWNIPIDVVPYTGPVREGEDSDGYYIITVHHPQEEIRTFIGWLYPLSWEYREEYCLYAGLQQAGPLYEILDDSVNNAVINGTYMDYQIESAFDTDFVFSHFDESQCGQG